MAKKNDEMEKTEVMQCRVTYGESLHLGLKSKVDDIDTAEAIHRGIEMYLNDRNGLLEKMAQRTDYVPKTEADYQELKSIRNSCNQLYQTLYAFQSGHQDLKSTAWKDTFKDFLLPTIDEALKTYELMHGYDGE